MLILLDTSAAFDTINIDILFNTLGSRFNISGTALDWFRSYLTGRSQCVMVGSSFSNTTLIYHGVPQGSVLGPVMFKYVHDIHCGYMYEASCAVPSIC